MSAPPGHNGPPAPDDQLIEAFMQRFQELVDQFGAERIRAAFSRQAGVDPAMPDAEFTENGAAARSLARAAFVIATPALGRFANLLTGDLVNASAGRRDELLLARDLPKSRVQNQFHRSVGVLLLECLALLIAFGWKNQDSAVRSQSEKLRRFYGEFGSVTKAREAILSKLAVGIDMGTYTDSDGTYMGRLPTEMRMIIDAVSGTLRKAANAKSAAMREVRGNTDALTEIGRVSEFWSLPAENQCRILSRLLRP